MAWEYTLDFVITCASILICVLITVIARRNEKKTVDGFLLGNRNMSLIPTALSTFATVMTANSFTSFVGESFANGMQLIIIPVGFFLMQLPIAYYIVPIFHNISYTSVYEYIERRFDKFLRIFFSAVYFFLNLLYNGVCLYVPAITVTTVTGVSYWITLVSAGLICTLYCTIGGLKAVIWTDVFQCVLMFGSVVIVMIAAFVDVGGVANAWTITFSGQTHQHFRVAEDLNNNYSVWNLLSFALAMSFYTTVGSQACAQRILCVKDYKTAKNVFLLSNVFGLILKVMVFMTGVAIFASLTKCNILAQPNSPIRLPDQIYIYVASKLLKGIPGVLGIILSGLISAALSSVSSIINAMAANCLEDFITPVFPSLKRQEKKRVILCRFLTAVFGVLTTVVGVIVPHVGGVMQIIMLVSGALVGPLSGILLLAFFYRKTSIRACKLSLLVTFVLSLWLTIGSYMYYPHRPQFKHSTEQFCDNDIVTYDLNITDVITESNVTYNANILKLEEKAASIYGLCSFWFGSISCILSSILGILFSFLFEQEKATDIRLLSPLVLTPSEKELILTMKAEKETLLLKGQKVNPENVPEEM